MTTRKKILTIVGSASNNSSNHKLVDIFARLTSDYFEIISAPDLKTLPHFDPELSADNPPAAVQSFREQIQKADGILISTPEYVFSIPSGLKNAIEWCVATTVFTDKPVGIITASAHGQKGHEELQLIMATVMAKFNEETTLLIHGIKGKIDAAGEITDQQTATNLNQFIAAFKNLVK
jgi:chromate reductase, NAD(P)H dehydrogenase (quinone)